MSAMSHQSVIAADVPKAVVALPPHLRVYQVAEVLGCCPRTVDRLIDKGRMRARYNGRHKIVYVADLQSYIENLEEVQPRAAAE